MVSAIGTTKDIETLRGISGYFTLLGYLFGTASLVVDGMEGFKFGISAGENIEDLKNPKALGNFEFKVADIFDKSGKDHPHMERQDDGESTTSDDSEDRDNEDDSTDLQDVVDVTPPGSDGDNPNTDDDDDDGAGGGGDEWWGDDSDIR